MINSLSLLEKVSALFLPFAYERSLVSNFILLLDEVRLWERETGRLFDTAPLPDDDDVELTCAAWNHGATDSLTLAAGANDGSLRVWKCPAP